MKKQKIIYYEGKSDVIKFLIGRRNTLKIKEENLLYEWDILQSKDILNPQLRQNEEEYTVVKAQSDLIEEILKFYEKKEN